MAAKIKDGLFIGDAETSQDTEFLELNKINSLINLSGREVNNIFASHGLIYLTLNWEDNNDYVLFDHRQDTLNEIVDFINTTLRHGSSVLLFSSKGTGRCIIAACAYLMVKYRWGFEKTYDFIYSKKPDIELNKGFIQQMFTLDKRIQQQRLKGSSSKGLSAKDKLRLTEWDPSYLDDNTTTPITNRNIRDSYNESGPFIEEFRLDSSDDERLLVNSYINSKAEVTTLPGPYLEEMDKPPQFRLKFNKVNQEEDKHMFPTNPPPPHVRPAYSILKDSARSKKALAAASAAATNGKPLRTTSVNSEEEFNMKLRNSNNNGEVPSRRDKDARANGAVGIARRGSASSVESDRDRYIDGGGELVGVGEDAFDNLSDVSEPQSYISIPEQRDSKQRGKQGSSSSNNNNVNSSIESDRRKVTAANLDRDRGGSSGRGNATAAAATGDLYDFVGLSNVPPPTAAASTTTSSSSGGGIIKSGNSGLSAAPVPSWGSPEDRLKSIVDGLHKTSNAFTAAASVQNNNTVNSNNKNMGNMSGISSSNNKTAINSSQGGQSSQGSSGNTVRVRGTAWGVDEEPLTTGAPRRGESKTDSTSASSSSSSRYYDSKLASQSKGMDNGGGGGGSSDPRMNGGLRSSVPVTASSSSAKEVYLDTHSISSTDSLGSNENKEIEIGGIEDHPHHPYNNNNSRNNNSSGGRGTGSGRGGETLDSGMTIYDIANTHISPVFPKHQAMTAENTTTASSGATAGSSTSNRDRGVRLSMDSLGSSIQQQQQQQQQSQRGSNSGTQPSSSSRASDRPSSSTGNTSTSNNNRLLPFQSSGGAVRARYDVVMDTSDDMLSNNSSSRYNNNNNNIPPGRSSQSNWGDTSTTAPLFGNKGNNNAGLQLSPTSQPKSNNSNNSGSSQKKYSTQPSSSTTTGGSSLAPAVRGLTPQGGQASLSSSLQSGGYTAPSATSSSRAPPTYRHGSPAPRLSRSGPVPSSSRQSAQNNIPSLSSNRSAASVGSVNSAGGKSADTMNSGISGMSGGQPRSSTPTRKSVGGSGSNNQTMPSTSTRSGARASSPAPGQSYSRDNDRESGAGATSYSSGRTRAPSPSSYSSSRDRDRDREAAQDNGGISRRNSSNSDGLDRYGTGAGASNGISRSQPQQTRSSTPTRGWRF